MKRFYERKPQNLERARRLLREGREEARNLPREPEPIRAEAEPVRSEAAPGPKGSSANGSTGASSPASNLQAWGRKLTQQLADNLNRQVLAEKAADQKAPAQSSKPNPPK